MDTSIITTFAKTHFGSTALFLKAKSPEIALAIGIGGGVVSTVMACRATLKAVDIVEDFKAKRDIIEKVHEDISEESYSEADYRRDTILNYIQTGSEFLKVYWPSLVVGGLSIGLILSSHRILTKRNAAVMAAYKAVDTGFKKYRARVVEELGLDADRKFRFGEVAEEYEVEDEKTGKKKKVIHTHAGMYDVSEYARWFDESSVQFKKNYDMNLFFLKSQQAYANDELRAKGHLFLNEVYDMLSLPRTKAGAVVGWLADGYGDGVVDFGLLEERNEEDPNLKHTQWQAFLLDFNVDGVIYDKFCN